MIALSRAAFMLIFHVVGLAVLSVPFILAAVCLYLHMQDDLWAGIGEFRSTLSEMPRQAVDAGVALGFLDPVGVELRRIGRERDGALRDIARLRTEAEAEMNRLTGKKPDRRLGRGGEE